MRQGHEKCRWCQISTLWEDTKVILNTVNDNIHVQNVKEGVEDNMQRIMDGIL